MSLINDALKKAEQLRSESTAPPPPMLARHVQAPRARTDRRPAFLFAVGGVLTVALLVGAVAALVVALKSGSPEVTPPAALTQQASANPSENLSKVIPISNPDSEASPVVSALPTRVPVPEPTSETVSIPVIAFKTPKDGAPGPGGDPPPISQPQSVPTAPPPVYNPPQPVAVLAPALSGRPEYLPPVAISSPVAASPGPSAPRPTVTQLSASSAPIQYQPTAPEPNPAVIAYVDRLEVQGIKLAGAGSKVLFNNRVFRINSIVNYELNIRVSGIKKNEIVFTDHVGISYTKYF